MTRRNKKLLARAALTLPLTSLWGAAAALLVPKLYGKDAPVLAGACGAIAAVLILWLLMLTFDEKYWAPRRRFAALRHLYLRYEAGEERLAEAALLGELEVCPIYEWDLSTLEDFGHLIYSYDGDLSGDVERDGRPVRATRCRISMAGRAWIERNPVMP